MNRNSVNRAILTTNNLQERDSFPHVKIFKLKKQTIKNFIKSSFPILEWISEYQIRRDLPMDIIAGITVTILQIPQGIAYGFLAEVPPVCGLYTAFFTAFIYVLLGTSRHVNFGTFAVVCLMVGQTVAENSILDEHGVEIRPLHCININEIYRNVDILSAITFSVAMYLLVMYIFRLGILTSILSQTLVEAFTSACAFHLMFSQIKDLLGLDFQKRRSDYFKIGFTIYDVAINIESTNYASLVMSFGTMSLLIFNTEILKPMISKRTKVPVPMELIVLGIGIIMSFCTDLNGNYDMPILGTIPTGLPSPVVPEFKIMQYVAFDSLSIAIVSYIITMALGFTFARRGSYEVRPNQELLAMGMMNLLGSFFFCIPVSGSLSRTLVQYQIGGVSQITILISAFLILLILLYLGPVLKFLPKCMLASIIICAVYKMFLQIKSLKRFWLLSKLDAMIWVTTFTGTVVISIKIGLYIGISTAILVICYHFCTPNSHILGVVPDTEIYLSTDRYKNLREIQGLKIFRFDGGINFASKNVFKTHLINQIGINAKQIKIERMRDKRKLRPNEKLPDLLLPIKCVILDFSAVTHIDPAAIESLRNIEQDHADVGITMLLANASGEIVEKINNFDFVDNCGHQFTMFVSVHDAVMHATEFILNK